MRIGKTRPRNECKIDNCVVRNRTERHKRASGESPIIRHRERQVVSNARDKAGEVRESDVMPRER